MVNIAIELIDDHLRASVFMRPNNSPHLTYTIEGQQVDVWVDDIINLESDEVLTEIDNLVWATVLTMSIS